jgi:hypothetical protein
MLLKLFLELLLKIVELMLLELSLNSELNTLKDKMEFFMVLMEILVKLITNHHSLKYMLKLLTKSFILGKIANMKDINVWEPLAVKR